MNPTQPPTSEVTPPPISNEPKVVTSSVLEPPPEPNHTTSFAKKLLTALLTLTVFILVGASAFVYAIAYDKIKLLSNPDLQQKVAFFVQNISFMPKTPKFILAQAVLAQEKITKESFDISLAANSVDLSKILGLSSLDLSAKGKIDYSDVNDIKIAADISVTKDFNIEIRKSDPTLFFKINKLPNLLLAAIGLKTDQFASVTGKWVAYDTTPLQTEARKNLQDQEIEPFSHDYINENIQNFVDDRILKEIAMQKTSLDGNSVYKLTLTATPDLIDYLGQKVEEEAKKTSGAFLDSQTNSGAKLSDMVKGLNWEFDIDQKDYYIRKIVVSSSLEIDGSDYGSYGSLFLGTSGPTSTKSNISLAFVVKLDDFGRDIIIAKPDSSISFEDFTNTLSDILLEVYGGLLSSTQNSLPSNSDQIQPSY